MKDETPTSDTEDPRAVIWQDDVLERRGFADFLTKVLTEQTRAVSERQQHGLTVALDAGWGTGKTFFVKHWAEDLKQSGHPVVFFDAWENDLGEEAAIALMAAIKETMDEWVARMPAKQQLATRAEEVLGDVVKGLRKAVWPVSKELLKGAVKATTGVAVDKILQGQNEEDEKGEELSAEKIEARLDKIFESALGEQKKRSEAIKNFKASMSRALEIICQHADAKLPAFVFVDELDRCRPSYAINLLEEIKHIFGMPNICFILSTNLDQLSHSTCAVYGGGFDSIGYLKRFFDQSFVLPEPNHQNFVKMLMEETRVLKARQYSIGLPQEMTPPEDRTAHYAISLLFSAIGLDLRSQRQVFTIADFAAAAIESDKKIFLVWLFFLCALVHKNPKEFDLIISKNDPAEFNSVMKKLIKQKLKIIVMKTDEFGRKTKPDLIELSRVIGHYYAWSNKEITEIQSYAFSAGYPESNAMDIYQEMPNHRYVNQTYYPSIAKYLKIVRYAGYVQEPKLA